MPLRISSLFAWLFLAAFASSDALALRRATLTPGKYEYAGVLSPKSNNSDGKVRDDALAASGRQAPIVYGSLGGKTVWLAQAVAPSPATAAEYAAAARTGSPEALRAFIEAHPDGGIYVELARDRLEAMGAAASTSPPRIATPSPSPAIAPAAPPNDADRCTAEIATLTALRKNPSADAIAAFANAMTCAALRPQLARLAESAGLAPPPTPRPVARLPDRAPEAVGCAGEQRQLERLRAEPDLVSAKALYARLSCEALRPQLQRLMESLGEPPPPPERAVDRPPQPADDVTATCTAEADELVRLLDHPDREALRAFSAALRCKALAPQVTRLVEGLGG